jgi:hypothetical protein
MSATHPLILLSLTLPFLVACAQFPGFGRSAPPEAAPAVQTPDSDTARPEARAGRSPVATLGQAGLRPEALDQVSAEERAAALAPAAAGAQPLGETLAALGSPTEAGLWLRTGLVTSVTQGRVEVLDGSASLRVELRPSGAAPGSGSQLSLSAFNSLGVPLTQLVRLRVFAQ